jgi:HlyD family secretion protein
MTKMTWHRGVNTDLAGPIMAGLITLACGVGGFAAWGALAPMEGAVIAAAKVAVDGRNKVVQHLEGGIVREMLVREGDRVSAGDAVLVLDGAAARSEVNRLRLQLATIEAVEARLLAEREGAGTVSFSAAQLASHDPEVARLLRDQETEFAVRLRKHQTEIAILKEQIGALNEQIAGLAVLKEETRRQIGLLSEEREGLEALLAKGLTRKSQVLVLKRQEAELNGRQGQLAAAIAEASREIAQVRERIEQARSVRTGEASAELNELRFRHSTLLEQLRAAEDVSQRLVVRAPVSGAVVNMTKHAAGAVIASGQDIMTIVPENAGLVVEAHISPRDIDEVREGQGAWLNFSALDARQTPPVPGRVTYVSADRFENERTGEAYYLARLVMSEEQPAGFDPARIGPGQDVEVFITTGERTFFAYIAAPLTRTISRAFRET